MFSFIIISVTIDLISVVEEEYDYPTVQAIASII